MASDPNASAMTTEPTSENGRAAVGCSLAVAGADFPRASDAHWPMAPNVSDSPSSGGRLVVVPAGSFVMGADADDKFATDTERPAHQVTLAHALAVAKHPVTVAEYRAFAPGHAPADDPTWPVVNVNWREAQAYCAWLRRETGEPYRLLSEAEWEYVCRAGGTQPFASGGEITPADANFLYDETGARVGPGRRVTVGSYPPNAFGLYDLHGNVCEWVADAWHPNYVGAPSDGTARPVTALTTRRVIRGGGWDHLPRLLRCAGRDALPETARRDNLGFRIARTLED